MGSDQPYVKSPAFQIYPADFLADKNTLVMTAAEVGGYWLLLCVCWRENGLPDDVQELADLARTPVKQFQVSWERKIQRCFYQREDGRWTHNRLEKERVKQAENRDKRKAAGEKGAKVKWQTDSNAMALPCHALDNGDGNAIAKDSLSDCSFQSSTSITTSKEKKEMAHADKPRSPRQIKLCDEEYLENLQSMEAYSLLDVRSVHSKMVAWCELKGKVATRGRLLNWLNREDPAMAPLKRYDAAYNPQSDYVPETPPAPSVGWDELAQLGIKQ